MHHLSQENEWLKDQLKRNVQQFSMLRNLDLQENERLQSELLKKEEKKVSQLMKAQKAINIEEALKGSKYDWALSLKSKGMPNVKKEKCLILIVQMVGAAIFCIMAVIMKGTKTINQLKAVCRALFESFIFGAHETKLFLHNMIRKYVQAEVFVAWKILKAMDLAPKGSLNYRGIETLRSVEGLGKWEQGLLPASSTIQEKAQRIYQRGQVECPIRRTPSPLGEMFTFEYEPTLHLILKTSQLYEVAPRESVEICVTLDGAELCGYLNHLTAGVKIVDKRAVDPRSGRPLCTYTENLLGSSFACQSRNFCFILKSLIGMDTNDAYDEFSDFFKFFEKLRNEGLPASVYGPRLHPMIVWSSQDMSSLWKCLKTGTGARKNCYSYFCNLCPCNSKDILFFTVGNNRCHRCKWKESSKCYHWNVGDEDSIVKFQEELEIQMQEYFDTCGATLDEVTQQSKKKYKPNAVDKEADMWNIDFIPPSSTEEDLDALYF